MKHKTPRDEFTVDNHSQSPMADPLTFRLNRDFLRAHGLSRGRLTTILAQDLWIERHRNGVHPE